MSAPSALKPLARRLRDAGIFYYRKVTIYSCDLGKEVPFTSPPEIQVSIARDEDIAELTSGERHVLREEWLQRLSEGHVCFVARWNGVLAGYQWQSSTPVPIKEVRISFDPSKITQASWVYNGHTFPEFRRRGVLNALFAYQRKWSRDRGIKTWYAAVAKDNAISDAATRKGGFDTVVASIRYMTIFGVESKKVKILDGAGRPIVDAIG